MTEFRDISEVIIEPSLSGLTTATNVLVQDSLDSVDGGPIKTPFFYKYNGKHSSRRSNPR